MRRRPKANYQALTMMIALSLMSFASTRSAQAIQIPGVDYPLDEKSATVTGYVYDTTGDKGLRRNPHQVPGLTDLSMNSTLTFIDPTTSEPMVTTAGTFWIFQSTVSGGYMPPGIDTGDPLDYIFDIPGHPLISGTTYVHMRMESPHNSNLWETGSLISIPVDGAAYGMDVEPGEHTGEPDNLVRIVFYVTDDRTSARPIAPILMHPNANDMPTTITFNYDDTANYSGELVMAFDNVFGDYSTSEEQYPNQKLDFWWGDSDLPGVGESNRSFIVGNEPVQGTLHVTAEVEGFTTTSFSLEMGNEVRYYYRPLIEPLDQSDKENLFDVRLKNAVEGGQTSVSDFWLYE